MKVHSSWEHVLWFHQRCKAEFWRCLLGGMFIGKELTGTNKVKLCNTCQLAAKMPVRNELSWTKPDCAWERIHIDFAGPMEGMMFLIVVDSFSKWPEVIQMRTSTTIATIKELGGIFAQQGYPKVLVSYNGTQPRSSKITVRKWAHQINPISTPLQWPSWAISRKDSSKAVGGGSNGSFKHYCWLTGPHFARLCQNWRCPQRNSWEEY